MELKLSFNWGKTDKASKPIARFNNQTGLPEKEGNSYFYPLSLFDTAGVQALIDMYSDLPEVQAPVNYIIDKMTIIPFKHVVKRGDVDEEITGSVVYEVLKEPNQYGDKADFIKNFFLNRIVLGAGYINRIIPMGLTNPSQLYILPTAYTEPVLKINSKKDPRLNEISGYNVDFGHGKITLQADEVVAQFEANLSKKLDAIHSRLFAAILTSESLRANYEARVKIYRDRGAMGILSPDSVEVAHAMDKEAAKEMEHQFYDETGITGRKAPIRVSKAPLRYTQVGFNIDELKLNENKLQDFQTVCSLLNIDSVLFENSRGTYNNKVLAKKNFWEDVGIPSFNSFLELLGKVFNLPENERLEADYSDIPALQENFETKVNAHSKAYNDGSITQREYREALGLEGGEDKYKWEIEQEASSAPAPSQED